MINKLSSFVFNGPEENAPMCDWVLWVPLIPVAAAVVWIGFTLFVCWIVICIMFGMVDDDD